MRCITDLLAINPEALEWILYFHCDSSDLLLVTA